MEELAEDAVAYKCYCCCEPHNKQLRKQWNVQKEFFKRRIQNTIALQSRKKRNNRL